MATTKITEECTYCWGTGQHPAYYSGGSPVTCPKCSGTGKVEMGQLEDLADAIAVLQADMDIIKPQIQALYDDLNP